MSDPVPMAVPADSDLLVSIHLAEQRGPATAHALARQTSYVSGHGDHGRQPPLARLPGRPPATPAPLETPGRAQRGNQR
ncbi:hypothetical protein [Actinopolyspora lacussalsi]|uniref:hypothetical protein n=1 Tax=Actinopolyspora righensis TaxID=995060 RepID=UPI001113CBEE|nr:hypothetical protein [Actinopolyspora righensis]